MCVCVCVCECVISDDRWKRIGYGWLWDYLIDMRHCVCVV